jgi:Fe-S cluster assembly iron-binding protein IscA
MPPRFCGVVERKHRTGVKHMLEVTEKAATLLKAARSAQGASDDSGIRIQRAAVPERRDRIAIGFAVSTEPHSGDDAFEQHGLRFFIEQELVAPLDGRTLDVNDVSESPELVFR